ncbi:MAG: ankyrin repeat domain-containing protein [Bacteroidota bacterium]
MQDLNDFLSRYSNRDGKDPLRIDSKNNKGETPLHFAVFQAGCYEQKAHETSIITTKNSYINLCKIFLSKAKKLVIAGANINEKSNAETTALIVAFLQHKATNTIKYILKFPHIDVTVKNKEQLTALEIVAYNNHTGVLALLLEKVNMNSRKHVKAVNDAYQLAKETPSSQDAKKLLKQKLKARYN